MWASTPILCSKFSAHLYKSYYLTPLQDVKVNNTSVARDACVRGYDILDRTILTNKQAERGGVWQQKGFCNKFREKRPRCTKIETAAHKKMHIQGDLEGKVNFLKGGCIGYCIYKLV
jgi:hypothetical protein